MIDLETWRKGWSLLDRRQRLRAGLVLALMIVTALSSAVMVGSVLPFLLVLGDPERIRSVAVLAWAYQAGQFQSDYDFLVALGVGSLAVIVAANFLQILRSWAVSRFATMSGHALSLRLLANYLTQPYAYFLDHHSGEMGTKILGESGEVVGRFFRPAGDLISSTLTVLAIVSLLVWMDPVVAVTAFTVLGGLYGGTFLLCRRFVARFGQARAEANRQRYRLTSEALTGVKDIKLLGREASYVDRYGAASKRMAQSAIGVALLSEIPQYVMQAVGFGGILILVLMLLDPAGLASGSALGGLLPLLGVFAFAGQRLLPELSKLYHCLTALNYGAAAVDTVHQDLVSWPIDTEKAWARPSALGLKQELSLEDVSYRYPNADRAGLFDVSLTLKAGQKLGVVGSTGAGKTTLADVVLGLLSPSDGRLVVDGQEITAANVRAWQQTVGYVPQDIFLTDASVAENIALGVRPDEIDLARAENAARIAQIHDFVVSELPKGYGTKIGERGVRLSGGQRQRVGIARALYHDAALIVFDEATSALDNLTEREVMSAIEALPGDKTSLIIAHRLSTVRACDLIAVLDQGRLVGLGSWDDLMRGSAEFRQIAQVDKAA